MTINNIVPGFRSAGIYPFAPNVILDKFPKPKEVSISEDPINSAEETSDKADGIEYSSSMENDDHDVTSLTPKTIKLHETRLENGYNVYTDLNYVEKNHPDHLPPPWYVDVCSCVSQSYCCVKYNCHHVFVLQMYC